ncbi:hypothetical protein HZY97_15430 [Sphingomonas sp. R-74633]|uniref:DUF6445 family protein n=1 Tax=Sphingomonas sp. R-74633 TaxID=2751188 RepID=UPI0015D1872C|nr:DUF6445 family protein [Sphingomonas sp. R-74633]NYT42162.1 hypothetical protein [Sphingomonas sp. R-74633]
MSVLSHDFSLNARPAARLSRLGREGEPLFCLDGLMQRPQALVDYAATQAEFAPVHGPAGGYPGVRAPAPLDYVEAVVRALDPVVRDAFALGAVRLGRAECNFSMVTLAPGDLVPSQRAPHIDTSDPLHFAFLHYLCGPEQGGTAFYRHRATGFEAITPERAAAYEAARAVEPDPAPGYIHGDTPEFEQIGAADAAFDRLLVYRSRQLHSGLPTGALAPDPRRGRLTANIFLSYRPA